MTQHDERSLRQELAEVEAYAVEVTQRLRRIEGYRDRLLRDLCDLEGAHDRHPVAVR